MTVIPRRRHTPPPGEYNLWRSEALSSDTSSRKACGLRSYHGSDRGRAARRSLRAEQHDVSPRGALLRPCVPTAPNRLRSAIRVRICVFGDGKLAYAAASAGSTLGRWEMITSTPTSLPRQIEQSVSATWTSPLVACPAVWLSSPRHSAQGRSGTPRTDALPA